MMKKNKGTNILLWVLQILLAFWFVVGGIYMMGHHEELANEWALNNLPNVFWIILGVLQILLGLIVTGMINRKITSLAAACLAIISLLGLVLYFAYSGFPGLLWGVIPALLTGFVAYGRMDT